MMVLTGVFVSIKGHVIIFWITEVDWFKSHQTNILETFTFKHNVDIFVSHQDKSFPRELLPLNKPLQVTELKLHWINTHKKNLQMLQYCDRRWARCDEICMLALKKDIHSYSDSEVQKMTYVCEHLSLEVLSVYNINCIKMK